MKEACPKMSTHKDCDITIAFSQQHGLLVLRRVQLNWYIVV
jgi:hypothetical protein